MVAVAVGGCGRRGAPADAARVALGLAAGTAGDRPGDARADPVHRGVALAIAELNAEAAARGGPRFVVRKPPPSARTASAVAAALRADPAVAGVVGPTDSQSALDAAPVYADVEHDGAGAVAAVAPTATSPVLAGRSAWLFRVCADDAAASRAAARFARDSVGAARAAVLYRNDLYGKGWARAFGAAFRGAGGAVAFEAPHALAVPGDGPAGWAAPYAARVRATGAEVVVFVGGAAEAAALVRALRAAGVRAPVLGTDALSDAAESRWRGALAGVRYAALFDAARPSAGAGRRFVAAYRAAHGEDPDHRAALAYDATRLLGRAVRAARVRHPGLRPAELRPAVRAYLAAVGSGQPAFAGTAGPIAFDARHDVVDGAVAFVRVAPSVGAP